MRKILLLLLLLVFASACWAENVVPGDVLVVFKAEPGTKVTTESLSEGGRDFERVKRIAEELEAEVMEIYPSLSKLSNNIFTLLHSNTKYVDDLIKELLALPEVLSASPNHEVRLLSDTILTTPNDNLYDKQWGLKAIRAPQAWNITSGDSNVYVAVIDSGVDFSQADLKNNFEYASSQNFYGDTVMETVSIDHAHDILDLNGHGTHVAGIISAQGNNGLGVTGVSWNSKLIALRVASADGYEHALPFMNSRVTLAVEYIAKMLENPKFDRTLIVNISFGGCQSKKPEQMIEDNDPYWLAFSELSKTDKVLFCVSAGNNNLDIGLPTPENVQDKFEKGQYEYPAAFQGIDNMIVVANAMPFNNEGKFYARNGGSNYSTKYVDISAPGTNIWSTLSRKHNESYNIYPISQDRNDNYYVCISGTSMAAPFVSGTAALLLSKYPNATASQLKEAILNGANKYYATDYTANGFLDVEGALRYMEDNSISAKSIGLPIDSFLFPDNKFRSYVREKIDVDGNDYLSETEIANTTSIDISNCGISELKGIEIFNAVKTLDCSGNLFTNLSQSSLANASGEDFFLKNSVITWFRNNDVLSSISFNNCKNLEAIDIKNNKNLALLSVSGCDSLKKLDCTNNSLISLNIQGCGSLENLDCSINKLTLIDVTDCINLEFLVCDNNNLEKLDLNGCTSLTSLICDNNCIATLDLTHCAFPQDGFGVTLGTQKLYGLEIAKTDDSDYPYEVNLHKFIPVENTGNVVEVIGYKKNGSELPAISQYSTLKFKFSDKPAKISYKYKTIKSQGALDSPFIMDVSLEPTVVLPYQIKHNDNESTIFIDEKHFSDRALRSYLKQLGDLNGDGYLSIDEIRGIKYIYSIGEDFSSFKGIEYLTSLKGLNCTKNSLLKELKISNHPSLEEIDVSNCSQLTNIICRDNKRLVTLKANNCGKLETLLCRDNALTTLGISGCNSLKSIICGGNFLTQLDLKDCINLAELDCHSNSLSDLDLSYCKSLISLSCGGNRLTTLDLTQCPFSKNGYGVNVGKQQVYGLSIFDTYDSQYPYGVDLTEYVSWENQDNIIKHRILGHNFIGEIFDYPNPIQDYNDEAQTIHLHFSAKPASISYKYRTDPIKTQALTPTFLEDSPFIMEVIVDSETASVYDGTNLRIVELDEEHFPDDAFRKELKELFDWDDDNYLSSNEIETATVLYIGSDIHSLKGIEYLSALKEIEIGDGCDFRNRYSSAHDFVLDFSGFTSLKYFKSEGKIDNLNFSGCSSLAEIYCPGNELFSLDVTGCTSLVSLDCCGNYLTNLNVTDSTSLKVLLCSDNYSIKELDLRGFSSLISLDCSSSNIVSLDISGCTALTDQGFNFESNTFKSFKASGCSSLTSLNFSTHDSAEVQNLDVSYCTSLKRLLCDGSLEKLTVSGCVALEYLGCVATKLTTLDVSNLPSLTTLECYGDYSAGKGIRAINAGGCSSLEKLYCYENKLISLDISGCSSLTILDCHENNLIALDLNDCSNLKELVCYKNKIALLDISQCSKLEVLEVYENSLPIIDVSNAKPLKKLECSFQNIYGARLQHTNDKTYPYQFDLRTYIPEEKLENVTFVDEHNNGVIIFASKPTYTEYFYSVSYVDNIANMNVTVLFVDDEVDEVILKPVITTSSLSNGVARTTYTNLQLEVNVTDAAWSATGLPDGLSVNLTTGIISGTPLKAGKYTAKITATNEAGSDTKDFELVISGHPTDVPIASKFSDTNLRSYITEHFDSNNDGFLTQEEIATITSLDIHAKEISSLAGIENFTALTELDCSGNKITSLPELKSLTALTSLNCSSNGLLSLDISSCDKLTYLDCSSNKLESLDITHCPQLEHVDCAVNFITALNLSKSSTLVYLNCLDNKLTVLDLSVCSLLETLDCRDNNIAFLDISKCPALRNLENDSSVQIITAAIAPSIVTAALSEGIVGENYAETALEATGTKPITWTWSGDIPAGLRLSTEGNITGKPETAGSFNFTVTAKNSAGEDIKPFSIVIKAASSTTPLSPTTKPVIVTNILQPGTVNVLYSADLSATGVAPITWSKGSEWPSWLSLNSATGHLNGIPLSADTYVLKVIATNEAGSADKTFNIVIAKNSGTSEPSEPSTPDTPSSDNDPSEDNPSAGGNESAKPDLSNPSANDVNSEQIKEKQVGGHKSGFYTEVVKTTYLGTTEIRKALGNNWSSAPLRSIETDMDQTDNRTDAQKEAVLEELLENQNSQNSTVRYAFVLRSMKPKQSGVFTFALPLPADMQVGDILVWSHKRSSAGTASMVDIASVLDIVTSASGEDAIFIDTATGNETKVVPTSRAVSVSTYLEAGYEYEPVVMTIADEATSGNSNTNIEGNNNYVLGASGAGCNTVLLGFFALPFALCLFKKKRA